MTKLRILSATVSAIILIILFICYCSKDKPTAPETTIQRKLQTALDEVFSTYDGKGISAAVVLPGGDVWLGTANVDGSSPISTDHVFWIGSITKMFTAAAILQLIEERRLRFDDKLYQFLPTYANVDSSITIYQLLTHTSGVFDMPNHPLYSEMMEEDRSKIWTPEEIIMRMIDRPYFAPGEGWRYSSGGYVLLGMIIEKVTGNKVSQEFKQRFYEPLGLQNTFLDAEETITAEFANFWADSNDDGIEEEIPVLAVERYSETSTAYTAGGLFSSAEDVAKWTDALFGRKVVLSQDMLDHMLDFYTDLPSDFGWLGYGMGAEIFRTSMVNDTYAYGHGGWAAYYISATAYLPNYDVSITILLNSQNWMLWEKTMDALCKVIIDNFN
ncbi:MAG: serine hydrolase [bacterium]|nr:MAG: serine hydrolase [bacterium]